jgi:hypothetical protein
MSKNTEAITNICDTHNLQLEVNIESTSEQIENQLANGVKIQTKNDVTNLIKLLNRNDNFNITDLDEITQYLD